MITVHTVMGGYGYRHETSLWLQVVIVKEYYIYEIFRQAVDSE